MCVCERVIEFITCEGIKYVMDKVIKRNHNKLYLPVILSDFHQPRYFLPVYNWQLSFLEFEEETVCNVASG